MYLSELRGKVERVVRRCVELHFATGSWRIALNYLVKIIFSKVGREINAWFAGLRSHRLRGELAQVKDGGIMLIGIMIDGGVGDYLLSARYIRDLAKNTEPFQFDIYCKNPALAEWIFAKVPGYRASYVDLLYHHVQKSYSFRLFVVQFVVFYSEGADWPAIRERKKMASVLQNILNFDPVIRLMIVNHPYLDGHLGQKAVLMNARRSNFLQFMSKIEYGGDEFPLDFSTEICKQYDLQPRCYITIHNGFDQDVIITSKTATKCYKNFGAVVTLIKAKFPNLVVVQIGTKTSSPIQGVDFDLLNQTSLKEAAGLIKYARLHVDIEGGLVHLARSLGVKCCVVFGPTPANYFGYPANINISPKECGGCWWVTQTWMDLCPRGFEDPICMKSHDPQMIASKIIEELAGSEDGRRKTEDGKEQTDFSLFCIAEERAKLERLPEDKR